MNEAIFIGRFQPFHKGHLDAIKQILKKHKSILIIIGSAQIKRTEKNPFSYIERKKILQKILNFEKINYKIISLNDYKKDITWINKLMIYKKNQFYSSNEYVVNLLNKYNFKVKKVNFNIKISAMKIRSYIKNNDETWKKYIPNLLIEDMINNGNKIIKKSV